MTSSPVKIFICDQDEPSRNSYQRILGRDWDLVFNSTLTELGARLESSRRRELMLVLIDPATADKGLVELVLRDSNANSLKFAVVSQNSDYEVMRLFYSSGALDYILKPVNENELKIKIEWAINKLHQSGPAQSPLKGFGIKPESLTYREFQILDFLLNSPRKSATRDEIQQAIWQDIVVNRKTLDVHLFNLRRKIRKVNCDILSKGRQFCFVKLRDPDRELVG